MTLPRLTTFAALRHPDYRRFWTGMVVSLVGQWVQSTAQSFLVWQLTRSPLATSLTTLFFSLPSTLLALLGGVAADRVDRRRLLLVTQSVFMVQAAVLAALTFTGRVQVWHIYLLALLNGTVMAFDAPARQSLIPSLVARQDLTNAIALNSTAFNGSRVIGPPIGGLIYAAVGPAWCFALNAVTYPAILIALWSIRPSRAAPRDGSRPLRDLRDGVAFAWRNPLIRGLLLMVALNGAFAFTYIVLMPVVASQVLGGGARENGFLIGAAGVGATLGALGVASVGTPRRPGRVIVTFGLLGGLGLVALSLSRQLGLSMAITAFAAGAIMAFMATCNSTIQAYTPDALRGRVMSLYTLALIGSGPFNALLAGALGNLIGAPLTIAVSGVLLGISILAIASRHRPMVDLDTYAPRLVPAEVEPALQPASSTR
ncbi:MAG TPA: MFS transporter [bacterium]|nr:MFS transporter [bacterium]